MIIMPGGEADDVIGTMSELHTAQTQNDDSLTIISTGDKDMAQLVNDKVHLINTMSNSYHDIQGVMDKYGVRPERIRDYLALMGDKSDNIPGVPKVGPKTAVKWLAEYDSLEEVMANADKFKGKIGESLRASLDFLPLSYELVTIKCDLDVDCSPEFVSFNEQNTAKLIELYQKYGLRTRLSKLEGGFDTQLAPATTNSDGSPKAYEPPIPEVPEIKQVDYQTILTEAHLDEWIAKLETTKLFAFDTETTSLAYMDAQLVGMSFCIEAGTAAYLPLAHDYVGAPQQLPFEQTLAKLKPLLENPTHLKVGQNLKYDRSILLNHGIELKGIAHDTMLESYVLDSVSTRHDMNALCEKHLNHSCVKFEDVAGKGKKQLTFNQVELDENEETGFKGASYYASEDADMTMRLHNFLWPQLRPRHSMAKLYQEVELPLLKVLSDIERNGVLVDAEMLSQQSIQLNQRMVELETKIYEAAGEEFNLGSPKQIQEVFFNEEKLNLPIITKTKKGQPSTGVEVLEKLAEEHDVPRWLLEHRGLSKLKSTYTDKLPKEINDKTGRVHTSYHQAITATGRLSSTTPNLQNIPIRTEEGRKIRQAFIPPQGFKILAADYSQIELRIMAHLSKDEGLVKAFSEGKDIHQATAAEIFEVSLDQVETNQRRAAKAVNFGLIYGMSAFGLAKQLKVSRTEAAEYVKRYFMRYPGVKHYMEDTREKAKDDGFVETLFGRRLYLPNINARNGMLRQHAERTAINAPMQGTAADIIKLSMIAVSDWLREAHAKQSTQTKLIMQVHDELVFEVAEDELEVVEKVIIEKMVSAATLAVPLIVDTGIGDNWDEAH
jgi:DNA polymerase-1